MEKYNKGDGHDFKSIESLVGEVLSRIHEKADNPTDVIGTPTGFYDLDRVTAGLHPGELVVLAACPRMGKTSMAISIATHVAVNERLPVAIATMGMGAHQLTHRIIASLSGINTDHL